MNKFHIQFCLLFSVFNISQPTKAAAIGMEISFLVLFLCLVFLISFFLYRLTNRNVYRKATGRLPPGTRGLPFIGEGLHYLANVRAGVPEKFVKERMKKYSSDVFRTSLLGEPIIIMPGAEANKFIYSNEQKLVRVWQSGSSDELYSHAEALKKMRKLYPSLFRADKLQEYIATMDKVIKEQLQTDWKCEQVKFSTESKKYTVAAECQILFGMDDTKKINEFTKSMEHLENNVYPIPIYFPGTVLYRHIQASKVLRREVDAMIKQRKADLLEKSSSSQKQDFMTQILLSSDENGHFMSESDVARFLYTSLEASYVGLHIVITMVMKYLTDYPDVYNGVLKEQKEIADSKGPKELLTLEDTRKMKYTWNVVCEVMRHIPTGLGGFREAITDFTYKGYLIPKGWKIHVMMSATHRDPEYFPDPEKFDPSRFEGKSPVPYSFVPFGGGPRMCPGYEFTKLIIIVFIHNVIVNFKWEKLIPDEKIFHDETPKPAQGFPVRLYPRKP